MKTKIEIIDEVVKHFQKNPRSLNEKHHYVYLNDKGHRCAHSIFIMDDLIKDISEIVKDNWSAFHLIEKKGDDIHKPEYRGHDPIFWNHIQAIHDEPTYWDGKRLTTLGRKYVNELKSKYKEYESACIILN